MVAAGVLGVGPAFEGGEGAVEGFLAAGGAPADQADRRGGVHATVDQRLRQRDPAYANRRSQIERFTQEWTTRRAATASSLPVMAKPPSPTMKP